MSKDINKVIIIVNEMLIIPSKIDKLEYFPLILGDEGQRLIQH